MGEVELSTRGLALRAEVFPEDTDDLVLPPFTAPTQEPLRLPEGNYQVRFSAPYRLGETISLSVVRGKTVRPGVDLARRDLGEPLPCIGVFELVPRGRGHDVITGASENKLNCYDGASGKLRWSSEVKFGRLRRARDVETRDPHRVQMLHSEISGRTPYLLQPCRDLDGDGDADLVWSDTNESGLLALSGKDGKVLWHFLPQEGEVPTCRAAWLAPEQNAPALILAVCTTEQGCWGEGIVPRTGRSVWRQPFPREWFAGPDNVLGPWLLRVEGSQVMVCIIGSRLAALGPRTGKLAWNIDLGFVPAGPPAFANLKGHGRLGALVSEPNRSRETADPKKTPAAGTLHALALPTGTLLWRHTLPGNPQFSGVPIGPIAADLNGDGKPEVIVPHEAGTVAVLDGSSGAILWRSSVAVRAGNSPSFPSTACVVVGPDLDGDGWRDLFAVNMVSDPFGASGNVIRAQALSGKSGEALWRAHFSTPSLDRNWGTTSNPLITWHKGRDGWPLLAVPGLDRTLVLEGGSGRVAHVIPGVPGPFRCGDLDGDILLP
jgi:outer membrane protein assembly factor BamB